MEKGMNACMRDIGRLGQALALALTVTLVAGCDTKTTAEGNVVEMRDMEVVDGTANDAMTNLDAVRADGIGVGSNEQNASAPARPASPAAAKDTETVPAE
jgi:hypothetical protein